MKLSTDTFSACIFTVLTVCCKCNSSGNKVLDVIAQWAEWTLWRGKYKGDVIKYSVCRSTPRVGTLPRKNNNIQMLFTLGLILIVSSLSKLPAWPPGWSWQHFPCSCTRCASFFPLSAQLQRAGRERWGIWDKDGTHGGEFGMRMEHTSLASERGFVFKRVFVKIERTERVANSLEVKLSMQKISVARASEKKIISGWVM